VADSVLLQSSPGHYQQKPKILQKYSGSFLVHWVYNVTFEVRLNFFWPKWLWIVAKMTVTDLVCGQNGLFVAKTLASIGVTFRYKAERYSAID